MNPNFSSDDYQQSKNTTQEPKELVKGQLARLGSYFPVKYDINRTFIDLNKEQWRRIN